MKVSRFESFKSKQTGTLIKVTKVVRSAAGNRFDNCVVRSYENGKPQPGSVRVVFADSIRRRYWKV
jgi:hypothetical protein